MSAPTPLLFGELFFGLRSAGLKIGLSEWMALLEALSKGAADASFVGFYQVSRALLIKDEARYDTFDQVFSAVYGDGQMPKALTDELLKWLEQPVLPRLLSDEERAALDQLPLDKLRELFEQRMKEQKERHDRGNRWVGTGGTSPFGHGGTHPGGVRVGGSGGGRSAVQIASERRFAGYRKDRIIDTRSIKVALKKLRRLTRDDGEPELDVDESIDATCKNAGELELIFRPPRANQSRVLLLMDVGGSMDPYVHLVERLFSAASSLNHWRRFEAFSFHNCPYEKLYPDVYGQGGVDTAEVLRDWRPDTYLIVVGDASMAPSELLDRFGAIDYYHRNEASVLQWLHRMRKRFRRAAWINPMEPQWWGGWTTKLIGQLFPMFPLTLQGLDDAIDTLRKRRPAPVPELDPRLFERWGY